MIIAEIGQNYIGNIELAKALIMLSKRAGADLTKFQLFDYEKLYPEHNVPKVELTFKEAKELFDYGKEIGQEVFFSVFDTERVKWCEEIGVKRYKIAYSMRDFPTLKALSTTGKDLIISTDSETDNEIEKYVWAYRKVGQVIKLLYCVPQYPASLDDIDFNARIDSWDSTNTFDIIDGFSDHTIGLDASKIALARGATIIEKHFCLNHSTGIDAPWSMTPEELKELKRWHDLCVQLL